MGQGVPGLAGEATASAVVSYKRGFVNGVPPPSGAAERPGKRPKASLPLPYAQGEAPREGAGPRERGGAYGRAGPIDVIQLLRGACRLGRSRRGWTAGVSGLAEGDVGQRTPGGCGWGGRDCDLHQRSRLLPPFAAAPRVPAAPAAGNAPASDRAPTRRRLDTGSVVGGRAG